MATIDFRTQALANLYLNGNNAANTGHLNYWRDQSGINAEYKSDIAALDNRIANLQNIITDGAKLGSEESPYDAAYLKREFMEEVFGLMMKRSEYHGTINNIYFGGISSISQNVTTGGLLNPNTYHRAVPVPGSFPPQYTQGEIIWDGRNFSNMSYDAMRNVLNSTSGNGALPVWDTYMAWIDAALAEGNKLKSNPIDPTTGQPVVSKAVTAITERVVGGITYDRITSEPIPGANFPDSRDNYRYYLIAKGAQVYEGSKDSVTGVRANPVGAALGTSATSPNPIDTFIGLDPGPMSNSTYLQVDKELNPVTGAVTIISAQRNLSPSWYIYYWNEARVKILRAQLAYKEAITSEIRDDLSKANKAFADLEKQAGSTRAQSADGKTMNPDLSDETLNMNIFYAMNAKQGTSLVDKAGVDTRHNFADWQTNRSTLKTYIDQKSTQSQDAMLDYQTTLNRYNNAYEVMSKLQEKLDGLVKNQLRNVA